MTEIMPIGHHSTKDLTVPHGDEGNIKVHGRSFQVSGCIQQL